MAQVEQVNPSWAHAAPKAQHLNNIVKDVLLYIGIAFVFASATFILFVIWLLLA